MVVGIKAKNSSDIHVSNSIFWGLDTDIELDNVKNFTGTNNKHSVGINENSLKLTRWQIFWSIIGVIATIAVPVYLNSSADASKPAVDINNSKGIQFHDSIIEGGVNTGSSQDIQFTKTRITQ